MDVSSELLNKNTNPHCSLLAQKEETKCITTEGREQAEYVFPSPVKPSVSALLCLCLVGKRWGIGQTPSVHCCTWTWDVSVLVLMLAQRCIYILIRTIRHTPQLVNGQSRTDAEK